MSRTFPPTLVFIPTGSAQPLLSHEARYVTVYRPDGVTVESNLQVQLANGTYIAAADGRVMVDASSRSPRLKLEDNVFVQPLVAKPDGSTLATPVLADAEEVLANANANFGPTSVILGRQPDKNASTQQVFDSLPAVALAPWVITPPGAVLAASSAGAWYAANNATFQRFSLDRPRTFRYINLFVGVQSGNIQVGVVRLRPGTGTTSTDYERVATSGTIACPASGTARIDLGFFALTPGDYALFLWCDNTTATFLNGLATGLGASRLLFNNSNAAGVAAGVGTASVTTRWVSGITLEAANLPISALGDSITANDAAGVGTGGAWLSNADQQTGYRFYPITNNGAAGERTDQILTRAAAALAGKRYATILAGTNDIGQNVPAATIQTNLAALWAAAVTAGLTGFACCTIPPRTATAGQAAVLKTVNAWIRANYGSYAGAVLVDWAWALSDGTNEASPLAANFNDEGGGLYIHPTALGSAIMTRILKQAIREWA